MDLTLVPHPSSGPCPFTVTATVKLGTSWELTYQVQGPLEKLNLATLSSSAGFHTGLWKDTCFEFFLGSVGNSAYREWNVAPSGAWWSASFSSPRVRSAVHSEQAPRLTAEKQKKRFTLTASFPLVPGAEIKWLVQPTVVLKTKLGICFYFTSRHAEQAPQPDFHRPDLWSQWP